MRKILRRSAFVLRSSAATNNSEERSVIIYLGQTLLFSSSELLLTEFWYVFPILCFVLAPNKDLAVSFLHFCKTRPDGRLYLLVLTFLFAPRILRWTAVSRYYFNLLPESGSSDFPPLTQLPTADN